MGPHDPLLPGGPHELSVRPWFLTPAFLSIHLPPKSAHHSPSSVI
ncbi:unnamed protein product, partial [Staurois parvus]